jgi:hypothetical protein
MSACKSSDGRRCVARCIKVLILCIAGGAALGLIVMWLWNWLMPALFSGLHTINFCEALGLLVLSKLLFGNLGSCCRHRDRRELYAGLTAEEREAMKTRLQSRWGKWCCSPKGTDEAGQ